MKIIHYIVCLCLIVSVMIISSCTIETYSVRKSYADSEILSYVVDKEIEVRPDSTGLVFYFTQSGTGESPKNGDKAAFHYKGYFLNGEVFDSSYGKSYPLIIELGENQIVTGLEMALLKMNKGSKATVIIPFYLAYDDMENAPVPPYSNLIFELELIDFTTEK